MAIKCKSSMQPIHNQFLLKFSHIVFLIIFATILHSGFCRIRASQPTLQATIHLNIPYAELNSIKTVFERARAFSGTSTGSSWLDLRDALEPLNNCSPDIALCLTLDVFAPTNSESQGRLLPVLVVLEELSLETSSPSEDGLHLLNLNAVIVKARFRSGILGFLNDKRTSKSWNEGAQDIILALEWVQSSIEGYGGDPQRVTVCGMGTVASSVLFAVTKNAATKGLMSGIIIEDLAQLAFTPPTIDIIQEIYRTYDCQDMNAQCLFSKKAAAKSGHKDEQFQMVEELDSRSKSANMNVESILVVHHLSSNQDLENIDRLLQGISEQSEGKVFSLISDTEVEWISSFAAQKKIMDILYGSPNESPDWPSFDSSTRASLIFRQNLPPTVGSAGSILPSLADWDVLERHARQAEGSKAADESAPDESEKDECEPQHGVLIPTSFLVLIVFLVVIFNVILISYILSRRRPSASEEEEENEEPEVVVSTKTPQVNAPPPAKQQNVPSVTVDSTSDRNQNQMTSGSRNTEHLDGEDDNGGPIARCESGESWDWDIDQEVDVGYNE